MRERKKVLRQTYYPDVVCPESSVHYRDLSIPRRGLKAKLRKLRGGGHGNRD